MIAANAQIPPIHNRLFLSLIYCYIVISETYVCNKMTVFYLHGSLFLPLLALRFNRSSGLSEYFPGEKAAVFS
jgi:hypothetical protein